MKRDRIDFVLKLDNQTNLNVLFRGARSAIRRTAILALMGALAEGGSEEHEMVSLRLKFVSLAPPCFFGVQSTCPGPRCGPRTSSCSFSV